MAKVEVEREIERPDATPPRPQQFLPGGWVVGLSGVVDLAQLRRVAEEWSDSGQRIAIVHPAPPGTGHELDNGHGHSGSVQLIVRDIPVSTPSPLVWLGQPAIYAALLAEAESLGASACVILNADLAALQPQTIEALVRPVLAAECGLAMPLYRAGRFDGLLNQAILAPLTRALYGLRVQFPLAQDFAVSAAFLPALRQSMSAPKAGAGLLWPATEAARRDQKVCQVYLPVHHTYTAAGLDLPALLQQIVGPLFADTEQHAAIWQRVRSSQATPLSGSDLTPAAAAPADAAPDPHPMVEAFQLAQRNLQDVWSLILPPVTLLELKKLSRQPMEGFRMADGLWARVVYDFALAYRLRTLSRGHLLGAMAPLYLGWVGSRVLEAEGLPSIDERQEQLERAFEENKPYLVQRWRWPDRFNP
jgi:glucosylglycerate synthase